MFDNKASSIIINSQIQTILVNLKTFSIKIQLQYLLYRALLSLLLVVYSFQNILRERQHFTQQQDSSLFFQIKKEMDLNNSQQKKYYKYFRVTKYYKYWMSFFEMFGEECYNNQATELNEAAFAQADLDLYPPTRTHFLIHAIQAQHKPPSEKSMLRSERKNQRRAVESGKQAVRRPMRQGRVIPMGQMMPMRIRMPFVLPEKKGIIYAKRKFMKRKGGRGRVNMGISPFNNPSFRTMVGLPPIGFPPMIPIGMIPTGIPVGIPMLGATNLPPIPPYPGKVPSVPGMMNAVPLMGPPVPPIGSIPMFQPPGMAMPSRPPGMPIMPVFGGLGIAPSMGKKKNQKPPKKASTAFKVRSPEQILLKSQRDACRTKVQEWRKESKPNLVEEVKEEVPLYFQKKKASQKRRRLEKHELIKKNVKALYEIYGEAIYRTGWPVSRRQIMEALGIKEESEVELDGISELMNEDKQELEKTEENTNYERQLEIVAEDLPEKEEYNEEPKVRLVLIKENTVASNVCLAPQLVYTG